MKQFIFIFSWLLFITSFSKDSKAQDPLFPNSVVSNDIDFILESDPDAFLSLAFLGLDDKEMPDSQSEILFDVGTYIFEASFSNDDTVEIWCHSSFNTEAAAQEYAEKLCPRLGKLPSIQRDMLHHVVIHNGDASAFAETDGNFFILYSDNMDDRISTNDLEETVFHESVHASIQDIYGDDPLWTNAQDNDNAFVTEYGQNLPNLEDMAESALFAYAYITYPGRLSTEIEDWLTTNNPNRLEFFGMFYSSATSNINNDLLEHSLSPYPVPVDNIMTINLESMKTNTPINVLNEAGVLVKSIIAKKGQNDIDLSNLSKGVYFLSVPEYKLTQIIKM